ncbi:MAG: hypothetical protein GX111_09140 [Clostridiales bacterium]|nr:hypothetical protein [Clostridiales bacterium]
MKILSRTEEIDLAARYDGGHLLLSAKQVSLNRFFLTICAAASRQNGGFL